MTWKEELNLLTMFHEENVGFLDRKGNINSNFNEMKEEEDEKKTESEEEAKYVKIKSLGRGRKIPSGNKEFFITKIIEETLGISHRSENMFFTRSASTSSSSTKDKIILTSRPQVARRVEIKIKKMKNDNDMFNKG